MKTRISRVLQGSFLIGVLAAALQAGQAPQGGEAKPAGAPPPAAPATQQAAQPAQAPANRNDSAAAPPSTIIYLSSGGTDTMQLGIQANGAFSYPFTFTATPAFTNGVSISFAGVISGTPTKTDDQTVKIAVTDSNGKPIGAPFTVTLRIGRSPVVMLGSGSNAPAPAVNNPSTSKDQAMIAANTIYTGGDTITGSVISLQQNSGTQQGAAPQQGAAKTGAAGTCTASNSPVNLKRGEDNVTVLTDSNCKFSYQFNTPFRLNDKIVASMDSVAGSSSLTSNSKTPPNIFGEELRAIVGYQQAGSSFSNFSQNWFVDFYISRPVIFPSEHVNIGQDEYGKKLYEVKDNHLRWWGNVRVASFPQSGNQTVAETAAGLPTEVGGLKLNQLAEGAEFLAGLEGVFYRTPPLRGFSENTLQTFNFGIVAGFGATGFFSSPSANVPVFVVPASGPQLAAFQQAYGTVSTPYVGFIQPDSQRFQKEYLAGLRLTTRYLDPSGTPLTTAPAMLAVTLGQNQVITAGHYTGVVGRFEAFYPLPFGNRGTGVAGAFSSVYLFGTAQMRLGGKRTPTPSLVLGPAPTGVNPYDTNVTLIPTPSGRDEYRIGFGVDLVNLISQLTGGTSKNSSGNATPAKPAKPSTGSSPAPDANASPSP
jgi:hypothetical protein